MVKFEFKIPTKEQYFGATPLTVLEMVKKLSENINRLGKLIGCDALSPNFTICNIPFFLMISTFLGFVALNVYGLHIYRSDLDKLLFSLVTFFSVLQGVPLLYYFIYKREKNLELVARVEKFIINSNTECEAIFEKWIVICCHVCSVAVVGISSGTLLVYIYPLIYYVFVGEKVLHYGFELPMVDWHTWPGYSLNFIYVATLLYVYSSAIIASVTAICYYLILAFGQFEILKHLLEELDKLAIDNEDGEKNEEIKSAIREIAQRHQELDE